MGAMALRKSSPQTLALRICAVAFGWAGMSLPSVVAGAGIEGGTPGVSTQQQVKPWQREVVYQIYPRSFADGNGDGIGDLRGITAKADYIKDLGVDMVWLCPVTRTTNYDNGYDVSDYLDIDPTFGSLADWEAMRDALHQRGIKIMMDLVINHSSDAHPWFVQEKRLKTFEHQLPLEAPAGSDPEVFRRTVQALLTGNGVPAGVDVRGAPYHELQERIEAFKNAQEARDAADRGYPSVVAQLQRLARLHYGTHDEMAQEASTSQDFYIWRVTPNNWTSVFSGSAWHRVDSAGLYYLALFTLHQPDLNWHNPVVRQVIYNMVQTWVKRGVDGFRLDSVGFIAKDQRFPDAPESDTARMGRGMQYFLNLPEVHEYLQELRRVAFGGQAVRTVGEVSYSPVDVALDYAGLQRQELTEVFLFDHMYVDVRKDKWHPAPFQLTEFKRVIGRQQRVTHGRAWVANYLENHDQLRAVSRYGDDKRYRRESATMLGTLLFTLEGTPYVYQGQEIGMTNSSFSRIDEVDDVEARNYYNASIAAGDIASEVFTQVAARNRDNVRTVMQWDEGRFAGFSNHRPWIRVNTNYTSINVKDEQHKSHSVLAYYKQLIRLRKDNDPLIIGEYNDLLPNDAHLWLFSRTIKEGAQERKAVVMLNFSGLPQIVPVPLPTLIAARPRLLIGNYAHQPPPASTLTLRPYEARVYVNY